jgi:hypothetical protein
MVVHNGIITNYKDIKALLVSVILSLVRKDLDVHTYTLLTFYLSTELKNIRLDTS